jgi:uridine monophosphate synthetase
MVLFTSLTWIALGPYIVALQTNSALIPDFSDIIVNHLKSIAAKHNFLLYETHYVRNDSLRVENWADIIDVSAAGDTLASLVQAISEPDFAWRGNRAIVAAPEMDVKRAAAIGFFSHDCVEEARENPTYIMGFVAPQGAVSNTLFFPAHLFPKRDT